MPKTTAELLASKAGETAESNGFGSQERPLRPAGVYQLKNDDGDVVDTIIVKVHPKFGDSQAAAAERVGYRFLRDAKPGEVKEIEVDAKYLATENLAGGQDANETLKGIQARLTAVEKENADLKAAKAAEENKGSADGDTKADAKDKAKVAAAEQLENRGQAPEGTANQTADELDNQDQGSEGSDEGSDEGDDEDEGEGGEKPFNKLNRAELEAVAEKEQITLPAEADTNAKIREVITKAREEKETE